MYIFPDGRIYCLQNVPLNPNSEDTFLFTGANDTEAYNNQFNYFYSKRNSSLDMLAQSYTRVGDGIIRAPGKADDYYAVNYIMFQNHAHGNKWFYAFITKIEYVNEGTTRLYFSIDPIQTYLYNYHTTECFVERMSTPTDGIGDWLSPEMVALGEYVCNNSFDYIGGNYNAKRIVVMYVDPSGGGKVYDRTFSAAKLKCYDPDDSADITRLNNFLTADTTNHDSIIGMYMTHAEFVNNTKNGDEAVAYDTGYIKSASVSPINANTTIGGYLPQNKKLLTFPFNYYRVSNGVGNQLCVRYEFFNNLTPTFIIKASTLPPVEMSINPLNYKGSLIAQNTQRVVNADFPMCSWSQDAYSAWWALNGNSYQTENQKVYATTLGKTALGIGTSLAGSQLAGTALASILGGAVTGGAGALAGAIVGSVGALTSIANGATSIYNRVMDTTALEAKLNDSAALTSGTYNGGNVNYASNGNLFYGERVSITGNMALKIDKFFTAYGYAIGYHRKPNRNNRSRFTYVKTAGCNVYGDVPVEAARIIANMYDSGIRFWKDTNNFCNYSLGNPI